MAAGTGHGYGPDSLPTTPCDTDIASSGHHTKSNPSGQISEITSGETDSTPGPTGSASKASSSGVPTGSAYMASSLSVQNEAPSTSTDIQTTIVTVAFCYGDQCSEVPVTTGVTIVTEEETVYLRSKPIKSAFFAPAMFMQNFIAGFGPRQLGDGTYGILYLIQIKKCLLLILRAIPENMLALFLQIQIDMKEK